jgi:AcrR family transcriptional regulator
MGITERREREKAETRRLIMEAAREMLISVGYAGVSMRKLAEEIEYSPAAIYVHFKDKDDLIRQTCMEDFEALARAFAEMDWSSDPLERVRQLGRAYVRFGVEHPKQYLLMFMTEIPLQPDEQCLARKGDPAHDGYAALVAAVRDAVVDPRWKGETDVELVAQTLWAGVHGLTSMIVTMKDDPWIEWRSEADRVELLVQAMMEGLMRTRVAAAPAGATKVSKAKKVVQK